MAWKGLPDPAWYACSRCVDDPLPFVINSCVVSMPCYIAGLDHISFDWPCRVWRLYCEVLWIKWAQKAWFATSCVIAQGIRAAPCTRFWSSYQYVDHSRSSHMGMAAFGIIWNEIITFVLRLKIFVSRLKTCVLMSRKIAHASQTSQTILCEQKLFLKIGYQDTEARRHCERWKRAYLWNLYDVWLVLKGL